MEVLLFVGLQGAGKTTFYRSHFETTHVLVSKDRFRNNRRPQRRQMFLIDEALREGRSVVVDNTNATVEDRAPVIALAKEHGAAATGYFFDVPLEVCLERNSRRAGKERVPDRALYIAARRLRPPSYDEGFDRLFRVGLLPDGTLATPERIEAIAH